MLAAPVDNFAVGSARAGTLNGFPGLPGFSTEVSIFLGGGAPAPFQTVVPTFDANDLVAVSIGVGMIPLIAPNFKQWMPHGLHSLIESGILLASITAVLLNLFLNGAKHDEAAIIAAAKQAEAH